MNHQNMSNTWGKIMRVARVKYNVPLNEMAAMELKKYETGQMHAPVSILQRVFVVGYGTMLVSRLNRNYRFMTKVQQKYNDFIPTEIPDTPIKSM